MVIARWCIILIVDILEAYYDIINKLEVLGLHFAIGIFFFPCLSSQPSAEKYCAWASKTPKSTSKERAEMKSPRRVPDN